MLPLLDAILLYPPAPRCILSFGGAVRCSRGREAGICSREESMCSRGHVLIWVQGILSRIHTLLQGILSRMHALGHRMRDEEEMKKRVRDEE